MIQGIPQTLSTKRRPLQGAVTIAGEDSVDQTQTRAGRNSMVQPISLGHPNAGLAATIYQRRLQNADKKLSMDPGNDELRARRDRTAATLKDLTAQKNPLRSTAMQSSAFDPGHILCEGTRSILGTSQQCIGNQPVLPGDGDGGSNCPATCPTGKVKVISGNNCSCQTSSVPTCATGQHYDATQKKCVNNSPSDSGGGSGSGSGSGGTTAPPPAATTMGTIAVIAIGLLLISGKTAALIGKAKVL